MSLGTCIPGMIERGEIDRTRGKRMAELFDELQQHYRASMGPEAAAAEASEATLKQLAREAKLKKRQTLLQISRQREALKDLSRFKGPDPYQAIRALLDDDDQAPYRGGNVVTAAQRIEFQMHGRVREFIERHRRTLAGRPNDPDGLKDVVRELHGQATGDERAKLFADAIGEAFEQLRQRFNAAGGDIRALKGFGLSHRHDPLLVRDAKVGPWIADILPLLDRARMIDERTGAPFTDAALRDVLADVHENIRTNGLTGEASAALRGPGKLANQRQEHRFLHFTDGDAWLSYAAKYGAGDDPFSAIIGHISGMAKDIAMMERLGPNPDATMRLLLDHVDRTEAQSDKRIVGAVLGNSAGRKLTETLWRYVKGDTNVPVVPSNRAAYHTVRFFQGYRNLNTARKLGASTIPAFFGDLQTAGMARQKYGLSAISEVNTGLMAHLFRLAPEVKVLESYLKQLNPASAEHRQAAARLGLGMHDAAQSMSAMARFYGEGTGPGWTQVVADSALRLSGVNAITETAQNAFGTEMLRTLGAHRQAKWADLPGDLRGSLESAGLDQHDWTAIRHAQPITIAGVPHVDAAAVSDRGAADRLMNWVLRGRAAAVQETSARSRAYTSLASSPGTVSGEAIRGIVQFRGFSVALFLKQMGILHSLGPVNGAKYAARFFIGSTLAGAAMIQARELIKGNDPQPMDTPGFWLRAALGGGGFSIVGDIAGSLVGAVVDPSVSSIGDFIGGPTVTDLEGWAGIARTALPGIKTRKDGTRREANPAGAAVRALDTLSPASTNWYAKAAWERMVIDQLRADVDPTSDQYLQRRSKALQNARQGAWWAAGHATPDRAPDWSNAFANSSDNMHHDR